MQKTLFIFLGLVLGTLGLAFGAPLLADTIAGEQDAPTSSATISQSQESDWRRTYLSDQEAALAHSGKLLPPRTMSILNTPGTLKHGQYMWEDDGVEDGEITIWVDLTRQIVSVFRNGHEIGTAVVVYGAEEKASPTGTFPILRRVRDYHSRSYDAPMPYSLFITNDGVALHGSPMAANRATHGCIGLPLEFARKLFESAKTSNIVTIVRSDPEQTKQLLFAQPI